MSTICSRHLAGIALATCFAFCGSGAADEIPWSTNIEESLQRANANGQPVLMEFTADWCVFCKKMEKNTFTNLDVAERISRDFVAVRVNADENKELVRELGIKGLPAILIVAPDLNVIERISGFQTPEALIPKLDAVTASRQQRPASSRVTSAPSPRMPSKPRQSLQNVGSQQPAFDEPSRFAPQSKRAELEFEPIAQEDAPQVNRRPAVTPRQQQFFEDAGSPAEPARSVAANPDSESFFKTISRENTDNDKPSQNAGPAFGGLCMVTAVEDRELIKGSVRNQVQYRGHTVYFTSSENKQRFLASPATYWPMLDGLCAMSLIDNDENVEGKLEFAAVFRNRIWLFASRETMEEFLLDPSDIAEDALERISDSGR